MNMFIITLLALWPWKQKEDTASVIYWDTASKFESGILVKTYRYLYCRNSGTIHLDLPDFWTPAYGKTKYSREHSLADLTISIDAKECRTKLSASTRKEGNTLLVIRNDYHLSRYDTDWFGDTMFMVKLWIVVADSARAWAMAWRWKYDMDGDTLMQADRGNSLGRRGSSIGYTSAKPKTDNEAALRPSAGQE